MKCNFEGISFDSDTILGVSVFVTCETPQFDRLFLEEKMIEVGYDVTSIFSRRAGVENEITASNLTKTMVKILEREFIDSVPIKSTYWFLPLRPGIQTAVDKLNLFLSKLQDCVRLITIPILDNAENRASFWELICREINERVESISKKTSKMELETSEPKTQSLWTKIISVKNNKEREEFEARLWFESLLKTIDEEIESETDRKSLKKYFREVMKGRSKRLAKKRFDQVLEKQCQEILGKMGAMFPIKANVIIKGEKT